MVKTIVNALPPPTPKDVYKTAGGQWTHPKGCVLCTVCAYTLLGGAVDPPKGCAHTTLLGVSHRGELATKVRYFGVKSTKVPLRGRWAPNL